MHNRLSIFSSRLRGSALIWTLLVVAGIEFYQARHLPQKYSSHEVDTLLQQLERPVKPAPLLILGDSVGRQIGSVLAERHPDKILSLACNAAVETTGQYFILKRYADKNPMPSKVILMMRYPLAGNLDTVYTENFVQRCFIHWPEIWSMALTKKDPEFTVMMIAYKFFPSLRYRMHLQKKIPGFLVADTYHGGDILQQPLTTPQGKSLLAPKPQETISSIYLAAMVKFLHEKGVPLVFVWSPRPESHRETPAPPLQRQFQELLREYPGFQVIQPPLFYPNEWFGDGVHLYPKPLQQVANDYQFLPESVP